MGKHSLSGELENPVEHFEDKVMVMKVSMRYKFEKKNQTDVFKRI